MTKKEPNQNVTIDSSSLTFKQLISMVGSSEMMSRLPNALQLRKSDEEILFTADFENAQITIYCSGLLIYERSGYATVSAVDRCASPTYYFTASEDEAKNGGNIVDCIGHIHRTSHGEILVSSIPEAEFEDMPWYMPIYYVCESRLDHNQEVREESHKEFSLDGNNNWAEELSTPDVLDEIVAQDEMTEKVKLLKALHMALSTLTKKQRQVIQLHYYQGYTQKQIATKMHISQPMVHKHLNSALSKLKKTLVE